MNATVSSRACTIVARNYLPYARVLGESFLRHHPTGSFTVLLIDGDEPEVGDGRFSCLRLWDIGLPQNEVRQLAAIYDVTELATAVKPRFLRYLLDRDGGEVLYLDPDIQVFGSLQEVWELARTHGIVLTPHTTHPLPRDGRRVDGFHILSAGVYNLGFIAVGTQSRTFLEWWWSSTRREALIDFNRMMFTDQRWIDLVPCFFDHYILKDPGFNVAYWNLHARNVTLEGDRYLVNGVPLRFFHFSGFDFHRPYLLSKHQGDRPRVLLSERPVLAKLCRDYAARLTASGLGQDQAPQYGWAELPSGVPLDSRMRRVYREALMAAERGIESEPPDPFDENDRARFLDWLNTPSSAKARRVSRYLYSLYRDRPDLQSAFPSLHGPSGERYLDWVRHDGIRQEKIPPQLVPAAVGRTADGEAARQTPTPGVNIAGYFRAELGIGEAARLLTRALETGNIPHATTAYAETSSRKSHPFRDRGDEMSRFDVNLVCVNGDQTPEFARSAGPEFFEGRHTAGYWFWELEHFPPTMHIGFDFVDEVWCATDFIADAVRSAGRKPVFTIPLPLVAPECAPGVDRKRLGLPERFMFLFIFDFFSILERKNPRGVIEAFSRAFRPDEGPILVIKSINGDQALNDLERLRATAADRPDILIVDTYYTAGEKNALVSLCDCYVSLHRSEGLGLTMAEAMAFGKPVIATAYSGNLHFMTPDNSYLVDYERAAVPPGCDPYPVGARWAEPDVEQAAALMHQVYEGRFKPNAKAERGRRDVLEDHTPAKSASLIASRLEQIRRDRRGVVASSPVLALAAARASDPVEDVHSLLGRLDQLTTPEVSPAPSGPFPRARLAAQRALLRILRPYWWRQRMLDNGLIAALRTVAAAAARGTAELRETQKRLEGLTHVENDVEARVETLARVEHDVEARVETLTRFERDVQTRFEALTRFENDVQAHLEALTRLGSDTQAHLESVSRDLAEAHRTAASLSQRLHAVPYMSNPGRFLVEEPSGRQHLGYRSNGAQAAPFYRGFEDIFRGPESLIRDRQRFYLPILREYARVLDVGCGRGEMLDLLREAGISAAGIDLDEGMIKRCLERGHTVVQADALEYLRQQPDGSIPAIFCAQVIEHLTFEELRTFLLLSRAKLEAGGALIAETVNPHSLEAFKTFWTDLTHQRPIFPEVALALCSLAGYPRADIVFPLGSGDLELDRPTQGEYAVIARKDRTETSDGIRST
jgi:glycosyltransferase involved in cell wall biosynthesis/2-polyprenyl-3-methyl-5-hydroxy-6-metoxy-1,4-benzoquinol methylase